MTQPQVPEAPAGFRWALPEGLDVPPDKLQMRLDFYSETLVLTEFEKERVSVRPVSATAVSAALARDLTFASGLLPPDSLWWSSDRNGARVALWRPAKVWPVALVNDPFKPPRRLKLPMPGLVFVCAPQRPPAIYAMKRRPSSPEDKVYNAPTFNTFGGGGTCQGTHHYGEDLSRIPEEFFSSYFTTAGDARGRSEKHPNDLFALWEELDGQGKYPNDDLVAIGTVEDIITGKGGIRWR
jgi:hypothetical protein